MHPVPVDRLRTGRDIAAVFRGRRQRAGRYLATHVRPRPPSEPHSDQPRVAVIASRRVGNAVARNRAKRLLREAARHTVLPPGTDVVLVARPAASEATLSQVHQELGELLRRLQTPSRGRR